MSLLNRLYKKLNGKQTKKRESNNSERKNNTESRTQKTHNRTDVCGILKLNYSGEYYNIIRLIETYKKYI